jgi:hypothetical protein
VCVRNTYVLNIIVQDILKALIKDNYNILNRNADVYITENSKEENLENKLINKLLNKLLIFFLDISIWHKIRKIIISLKLSRARPSLGGSTSARRGVRYINKYKTKIDRTIDFRATFCGLRASAYIRLFSVTGGPLHKYGQENRRLLKTQIQILNIQNPKIP